MYTKIAAIRHEMRISQQELANLSNVSQSQISKMERGTIVNPAYDKLMRIAEALGRSIDELVDRPDLSEVQRHFRLITSRPVLPFLYPCIVKGSL